MGKVIFEDEEMEETTDSSDLSYDCRELWMSTQDDTAPMADRNEAAAQLISKAEGGDSSAQYLVGRLYQDGPVLIPDSVETQYWFAQSARQGHVPAQYELGKLLLSNDPEVQDQALGIQWLEHLTQSAVQGNEYAQFFLDRWDSLKSPSIMLSVTRLSLMESRSTESGWRSSEKRGSPWGTNRTTMRSRPQAGRCRWGNRQLHHRLQRELATPNMISF